MRVRLATLFLLTALTVGARGNAVYQRYLSAELSSAPPISAEPSADGLVITHVDDSARCYDGWADPARPMTGDRIVEIRDGHGRGGEVRGLFDYGAYLKPINADEPWTLVVERANTSGTKRLVLLMPPAVRLHWDTAEWLARLSIDFYLPFLAIAAGILIGLLRPGDNPACLASLIFFALSVTIGLDVSQFVPHWRDVALFVRVTAAHVLPYLVLLFFLRFPTPSPVARRMPWLAPVLLVETLLSLGVGLVESFTLSHSFVAAETTRQWLAAAGLPLNVLERISTASAAAMILVALVSVVLNAARARSVDERRRLRIIATGAIVGLLPAVLLLGFAATGRRTSLGVLLTAIPLIGLFPISFAYAVVRHRVFGIRVILRKGLTYALVSRGFLVAEALAVTALLYFATGPLVHWMQPAPSVVLASGGTAAAMLVVAVGIRGLNRRVLLLIDRRFFRNAYDARRLLTDLSRAVRQLASRPEHLLERVTEEIAAALHPSRLAIFLAPSACPRLVPIAPPGGACWKTTAASAAADRFLLYVDQDSGSQRDAASPSDPLPFARPSLARHLDLAAAGDPETLDVGTSPGRSAATAAASRPDDGEGEAPCLEAEALYARFDARLVVPLVTNGRSLGFLLLGEKRSEEPYSSEDKDLLLTVAGQMAIALDYAQLISQVAEQAALKRELQIAQEVQAQLFPHERPAMRTLRYSGICRAARGVGGDFYDYLPLTGNRLGLAVADISGKGLPAALLMASLQALLRSHAPTHASTLAELGCELNRHLCETSDGARFATLFFGVYDDETRQLTYLNAGHVAPLVVGPGPGSGRPASVRRLDSGGMVLGLFGNQAYTPGCVALRSGDRLLVYSDGVTEASNAEGDMFGDERLLATVMDSASLDIEELTTRVVEEVDRFVGGAPQQDDITVIAAEVA